MFRLPPSFKPSLEQDQCDVTWPPDWNSESRHVDGIDGVSTLHEADASIRDFDDSPTVPVDTRAMSDVDMSGDVVDDAPVSGECRKEENDVKTASAQNCEQESSKPFDEPAPSNPFEQSSNPFEEPSSSNPFEESSSPSQPKPASGANPFEEENKNPFL